MMATFVYLYSILYRKVSILVPVAQLDRALASGAESSLINTYHSSPYMRFFTSNSGCVLTTDS